MTKTFFKVTDAAAKAPLLRTGLLLLVAFLLPQQALATAYVSFDSHAGYAHHGAIIERGAPFYDATDDKVLVSGSFGGVDIADVGAQLFINGQSVGYDTETPTSATFGAWVSVSELQPMETPYPWMFSDIYWFLTPVLVELTNASAQVVARERILLYDNRADDDHRHFHHPVDADGLIDAHLVTGFGVQVTPTGIRALGATLESALPLPDMPTLEAGVNEAAADQPSSLSESGDACQPIEAGSEWSTTPAYAAALALAVAAKETYDTALVNRKAECAIGPTERCIFWTLFLQQTCVRREPRLVDFKVCVGSATSSIVEVAIDALDAVDLDVGDGGDALISSVTLSGIDATAHTVLDNLKVAWAPTPLGCVEAARPKVPITDDLSSDFVEQWRTCPETALWATTAVSDNASFDVAPDGEAIDVTRREQADFTLLDIETDAGEVTCGEDFIDETVHASLEGLVPGVEASLDEGWRTDGGHPEAVADVLSTLELGLYEPDLYGLTATFDSLQVVAPDEGLSASWKTEAQLDHPSKRLGAHDTFVWLMSDPTPRHFDGRDPSGAPFDLSFTVTTGHINQVLRARAFSEDFVYSRMSWSDLGLEHLAPGDPSQPAVLSGEELSDFHPALARIGDNEVGIYVWPTLAPFTTMDRDGRELGAKPVRYQVGQLNVSIYGAGKHWLRFTVDLHDPSLHITMPSTPEALWLTTKPPMIGLPGDGQVWAWTVMEHDLGACFGGLHATAARSCMRDLEDTFGRLLDGPLETALYGLMDQLAAPAWFDAAGRASVTRQPTVTSQWNEEQNITFYTTLD